MEFAYRLRTLRKQAGFTQDFVAGRLGITRQAIAKWEAGDSQPDLDNLVALAELLDVSLDSLVLGREDAGHGKADGEPAATPALSATASAALEGPMLRQHLAHQQELELEMEKTQALFKLFRSVYRVDLEKGLYTELTCDIPAVHKAMGESGSTVQAVVRIASISPSTGISTELAEFLDPSTIGLRLGMRDYISCEVYTEYSGWTEYYVISGNRDKSGKLLTCYVAGHSIARQKEQERQAAEALTASIKREHAARDQALRDPLTGLLNRRAYEQALTVLGEAHDVGVAFCDVNGLKQANDSKGHGEGDHLLLRFTRILRDNFSDDCLYRIGGDEFIILVNGLSQSGMAKRIDTLRGVIKEEGDLASIGMAWGTGSELGSLLKIAEGAMYAEKARYKALR